MLSYWKYGGQGRNRTADASLFRAALYQLSYLATEQKSLVKGCCGRRIITTWEGLRQTRSRETSLPIDLI
jgi:hypothetical protein